MASRSKQFTRMVLATGICLVACNVNAQSSKQSTFDKWDQDGNGFVTRAEFPKQLPARNFEAADRNGDGKISREEDRAFLSKLRQGRTRGGIPEGTTVHRDLTYETVGDRKLPLDLYLPEGAEKAKQPLPLVIWIHGGGWKSGSKNGLGRCKALLAHGYALASVEYRLSGEAIFPAAIEDCKAAVSYLRLNAKKHNLDPERFGAWGSSAGGHLVALMGTTNDIEDFNTHPVCKQASPAVQAVCNWYGPSDFLRMNDFPSNIDHDAPDSPESRFIGGPIQESKDKVAQANPITHVSAGDPPMLLMHGDKDMLVAFNQSELLYAALEAHEVESELYKVVGGGHGFGGAKDPPQELVQRCVKFFDKHLKQ
ncbi:MAG: alpha/beta hydrolase [Planctomycetota bacterium]|nr:alpha/beta hydrolase [Planctomycetota bacterium]